MVYSSRPDSGRNARILPSSQPSHITSSHHITIVQPTKTFQHTYSSHSSYNHFHFSVSNEFHNVWRKERRGCDVIHSNQPLMIVLPSGMNSTQLQSRLGTYAIQ